MPKKTKKSKEKIQIQSIVEEMSTSYLDYAMSVIVARALPDVRDGLKPVHRRILYAMWDMGLKPNAKFRKSATVVGETLGKYHPHGDVAVYDSLVRLAQDFSMRYMLVNGQGNMGCFTKDTKVKLTDGRSLTFTGLMREHKKGKENYTYTFNHKTQKVEIAKIHAPRKTKKDAKLIKLTLDNGAEIRCTLNHKFMLRDGAFCEAQNLKKGSSLMPGYLRLSTKKDDPHAIGYLMIQQPKLHHWEFVHRLTDQWNLEQRIYPKEAGRVRHHKDFNKLNNNPDNVIRMDWKAHWKLHANLAAWRHKNDPIYVKKIAAGRKKYVENNREKLSKRRSQLNKKLWQDESFRKRQRIRIQEKWQDPAYKIFMQEISRANLKKLWRDESFRKHISKLKSLELKKRWEAPEYRAYWTKKTQEISNKLWASKKHREHMSRIRKQITSDPVWRKKQSALSKSLWKNPGYRAHYSADHFSKMARILWEDPATRVLHSKKAKKQWEDPAFREKITNAVRKKNRAMLKKNPDHMKKLSQRAAISLRKNWGDPEYKNRVMRGKILGFVHSLLKKNVRVTPKTYNAKRTNNGTPKLENALKYFDSFEKILEAAPQYNHTVVATEVLKEREDVYDLTIDNTHNFLLDAGIFVHNSVDGDSAAAMRYTEAKLASVSEELLLNIEKDTVDFRPNYDGSHQEPTVLPAKLPNLLLNGALGIAVGMATNIPPHNLGELSDAIVHLIKNPDSTVDDLMKFIKGPDFPTGGIIFDTQEIKRAYATGKGSIVMRAQCEIVEKKDGFQIVVDEIPYQVNKAQLIEKIAELVKAGKITGIKGMRDESDRSGLHITIDLKKDAFPKKVLNQLYKFTRLQDVFHVNMLALLDGIQPRVLTLKMVLEEYIKHRHTVIRRRTEFDLNNAKEREHILIGLVMALEKIDAIIATIKKSKDRDVAKINLIKKFKLSERQSEAILQMRLQALAGLEQLKVEKELAEKRKLIKELEALLKSKKKIQSVISNELEEVKARYADERRTKVIKGKIDSFSQEDLIPKEAVVIMITKDGYIKRLSPQSFKSQARGGKGVIGLTRKEEDTVEHMLFAQTHDDLLFFTTSGKVFQLKAHEVPEASRTAKGNAVVNFLELNQHESVSAVLPIDTKKQGGYFVMATERGIVKKVPTEAFVNVRRPGLIALKLKASDVLKWVKPAAESHDIIFATAQGLSIRFKGKDLRPMGRIAQGVIGIKLEKDDRVVGMATVRTQEKDGYLMVISENGYGKMTNVSQYRVQSRAGKGIKTTKVSKKTGALTSARVLYPKNLSKGKKGDLILISQNGQVIRIKLSSVPKLGRATQGVRLMRLKSTADKVAQVAVV